MTTERDLHDLLTRVASGELDPAEAARLMDSDDLLGDAPGDQTLPRESPTAAPRVTGVSVAAVGVRLTVVADPGVATAVADGPHKVRQEDGRLVFDLPGRERGSDGFEVKPRWQWGTMRFDWPYGSGERVALRINPALALRLELTACSANIRGLRSALETTGFSSSLVVTDHDGPLTAAVTTGSAKIEGVLRGPDDSVSCDMGSLQLTLLPGSDTTVTATADMGSARLSGAGEGSTTHDPTGLHQSATGVAGAGTGRLTVTVRMGSAKVALP